MVAICEVSTPHSCERRFEVWDFIGSQRIVVASCATIAEALDVIRRVVRVNGSGFRFVDHLT